MTSNRRLKPSYFALAGLALVAGAWLRQPSLHAEPSAALRPPVAAKQPHRIRSAHGTRVDDYYWLRDDTRTSKAVLDYLNAENAYRDAVTAPTEPLRKALFAELTARLEPDESSVPVFEHGAWYYQRYVPGLEYPVFARKKGATSAPEEVLLDENAAAKGLAFFAAAALSVSPDGKYLAYAEDRVGRSQFALRVKDLESGTLLADTVSNIEADLVWAHDSRTLLYIEKDPVTLRGVRVRAHRLGSEPARDALIYEERDPRYELAVDKSRSERHLYITASSTDETEWRYADASDPALRFSIVLPREPRHEYHVEHFGDDFIVRTNDRAPNFRIVRMKIERRADKRSWTELVPHRAEAFIEDFEVSTDGLSINERSGGLLKLRVRPWRGGEDVLVEASEPAYTMMLAHTPGLDSGKLRYVYTSLITPTSVFEYDLRTGKKELKKTEKVLGGYDPKNYVAEYVHAEARDGKPVPVSLAYRKGTRIDGTAPLFEYAYGAYGIASDPSFSSEWVSLLDRGFVIAVAHVRGGTELGRAWYEDGRLLHKRNTFTDFIDVRRHLVSKGYGAPDKVVAEGGSAGGLLMGVVANLAPQDYRVIVAHVPFVDAVTTMLDDKIPLTTGEFEEWGDPRQKRYYDYILSYSPYDNVKRQAYPAMLVFTGLWDSAVQYFEPAKWVAKLRAYKTDDRPLVFSIDMTAGHGGKSGRLARHQDTAREYAFIFDQLGIGK